MTLIRIQVRNEYGLGDPELHKGANKDDPKAILDGVAVAGLVGILRQLGDLAEFAAEVFHDLHEQVMATAAKSHKMITRVQHIESALPHLEKSVLVQTSHIHFAYTAGSDWHADIRTEENHFVHTDLPQFIMDSYEECRDPPRLFLLDKFDAAGSGACTSRYSDPSFFKKVWARSELAKAEQIHGEMRAKRGKKKGPRRRIGESRYATSISRRYSRLQFASPDTDGQSIDAENISISNMRSKSKLENRSHSFDSEPRSDYSERVLDVYSPLGPEELKCNKSPTSKLKTVYIDSETPIISNEQNGEGADDYLPHESLQECTVYGSSSVTWDEKTEIVKPASTPSVSISQDRDQFLGSLPVNIDQSKLVETSPPFEIISQDQDQVSESLPVSIDQPKLEVASPPSESISEVHDQDIVSLPVSIDQLKLEETSPPFESISQVHDQVSESLPLNIDQSKLEEGSLPFESLSRDRDQVSESLPVSIDQSELEEASSPFESISPDRDRASEPVPVSLDQSKLEEVAFCVANVDQDKIMFGVENIPEAVSRVNQFEEVTSEADNYMDALNTIDSEVETDCECQTKRELELQSEIKYKEVEFLTGGPHELASHESDSSDVETPVACCSSSNKYFPPTSSCSISLESLTDEELPQVSNETSDHGLSVNLGACEVVSRLNGFEPIKCDLPTESITPSSQENKVTVNSYQYPESTKTFDVPSVMFWTNGGLLGLEPSKPPDFVVTNATNQNSMPNSNNNIGKHDFSHHTVVPELHCDVSSGKAFTLVKPIKQMEQNSSTQGKQEGLPDIVRTTDHNLPEYVKSHHDQQNESIPARQNLPESVPAVSETMPEKHNALHPYNISSHSLEAELPVTAKAVPQPSGLSQNNNNISSGISGITHKFFVNGLGRKPSLFNGGSSEVGSTDLKKPQEQSNHIESKKWQSGLLTQASHESSLKARREVGSPESLTSSPPLEHMKISFHPINGIETSKLKLEIPHGLYFHESFQDAMFPSFQLFPEPTLQVQDMGSDSDDDTFYRSSPYSSEDLLSLHSESNSEQWESAEMTGSKDDEIYDSLRRIPSSSSLSSALDLEGINHHGIHPAYELDSLNAEGGMHPACESDRSLDHPGSGAVNSVTSVQQRGKGDSEQKGLRDSTLQDPNGLPPPPPLPPLQWRIIRSASPSPEKKQQNISEADGLPNDLQFEKPGTQKLNLVPQTKLHNEGEEVASSDKTMNLNGSRVISQSSNGKELDEREDLLHQIRMKSFNLRRTVPAKASSSSEPVTNVKVAAILEKANSIRQAFVGGDDENWSDG